MRMPFEPYELNLTGADKRHFKRLFTAVLLYCDTESPLLGDAAREEYVRRATILGKDPSRMDRIISMLRRDNDEFLVPFTRQDFAILQSWKSLIGDTFTLARHEDSGSLLVSPSTKAIYRVDLTIDQMGDMHRPPVKVFAILLPWKGTLIMPIRTVVSRKVTEISMEELDEICDSAIRQDAVITSL